MVFRAHMIICIPVASKDLTETITLFQEIWLKLLYNNVPYMHHQLMYFY